MRLIFGLDAAVSKWVADRIPEGGPFLNCAAIGIADGDRMIAGVVYHNYAKRDICMSMAAADPRWCQKGILRALFYYPFIQLGVKRVTALVASENKRSIRMVTRLGFVHEGTLRRRFSARNHGLVFGMLASKCKWLETGHE